jgi:hypothetical protein
MRQLGFEGEYQGAKQAFMVKSQDRLTLPSNAEYSVSQLKMMLREVSEIIGPEIGLDEWKKLS